MVISSSNKQGGRTSARENQTNLNHQTKHSAAFAEWQVSANDEGFQVLHDPEARVDHLEGFSGIEDGDVHQKEDLRHDDLKQPQHGARMAAWRDGGATRNSPKGCLLKW